MKLSNRILALLLILCISLTALISCDNNAGGNGEGGGGTENGGGSTPEYVDYVANTKLDMSTTSLKEEVTVKMFIDGDTTHFYLKSGTVNGSNVLKARYLAINTPESTGKIEEWGKAASNFTKEALSEATSIIVESDNESWNADSTGDRYLVWVWYKTADDAEYRNLNIEILQNGLAIASNSAQNRYGSTCVSAIDQARSQKLYVYSGEKDPSFPYGAATELTLKELRTNIEDYLGSKVAFTGVVTYNNSEGVYVESYDEQSDIYYGMYVYYGYGLDGFGRQVLKIGNEVRIVGTVGEFSGSYQVSGVTYDIMDIENPNNISKISDGNSPAYVEIDVSEFNNGTRDIPVGEDDVEESFKYAELLLGSSVYVKNLVVKSVYTTTNEDSSSKGAMTLTCQVGDQTIDIRTIVLYDSNGNLVTESDFKGKTIDVKGVVDCYEGAYQIKLFTMNDVTFLGE